jgi:hypothetical protein
MSIGSYRKWWVTGDSERRFLGGGVVQDNVAAMTPVGEVVAGVVDHVVRADGLHEVELAGACPR